MFLESRDGEDAITLPGEKGQAGQIKIETPSWFMSTDERFDIVLNVDSFTEMALDHANAYAEKSIEISRAFVSINHEINPFNCALPHYLGAPVLYDLGRHQSGDLVHMRLKKYGMTGSVRSQVSRHCGANSYKSTVRCVPSSGFFQSRHCFKKM